MKKKSRIVENSPIFLLWQNVSGQNASITNDSGFRLINGYEKQTRYERKEDKLQLKSRLKRVSSRFVCVLAYVCA